MKKFITFILAFIITISCTITSSFADSNLIFDILNKPTNTNSGIEVIDNILGKKKDTKVKIKIVNENTISDELESENKTIYKNKNKDDSNGIHKLKNSCNISIITICPTKFFGQRWLQDTKYLPI